MIPSWASSCRYLSVKSLPEALRVEDEEDPEEEEEEQQDHPDTLKVDGSAAAPGKTEARRASPGQHPAQAEERHRAAIQ